MVVRIRGVVSRRRLRRSCAAAAASLCVLATAAPGASPRPTAAQAPASAAANRARAARDAELLLARLSVPAGAVGLSGEPPGAAAIANTLPHAASPDLVDRHRWWRVPGSPASVLAHVTPPPEGSLDYTGSGAPPAYSFVAYAFAPVPGVLYARSLLVKVTGLAGDTTALRADAQVIWTIPRAPAERVPPGARVLDIAIGRPGRAPTSQLAVTVAARVGEIAAMIDRLPTVQPVTIVCPSYAPDSATITFSFRARRGGAALAQASELASATEPTTSCDAMSFSVRGHTETPLLDGPAVVARVERLLGVHL